jgi:hypothetical protein
VTPGRRSQNVSSKQERPGDTPGRSKRKIFSVSDIVERASARRSPVQGDLAYFPPRLTAKLGNVDSRNLTCAVALATLDRWEIPHVDGVAYLRRSEVRNLRRAWFGSKGVRVRPVGRGTMVLRLFDGFLRMEFAAPQTWGKADRRPKASKVRLIIRGDRTMSPRPYRSASGTSAGG